MRQHGWWCIILSTLVLPLAAQEPTLEDLQDLQQTLEQPIQAASKRTQRLKEAPADVTVLRGADLADLGYRTLGDALGGVLGFRTNQDRAYTGLGVRGLYVLGDQNTRVLILLDGHALNSAAEVGSSKIGEDFGIPMDQVERIEIIRGPASSLYGNNAFLGMVNVVTREPVRRPVGGMAELTQDSRALSGLDGTVGGTSGTTRWQATFSGMQRRGSITQFPELAPDALPGDLDREERQSAYLRASGPDWSLSGFTVDRTQWLSSAAFYSVIGSDVNRYRNRLSFADARYTPSFGEVETLVRVYGDRNEFSSDFLYDGIRQPGTQGLYSEDDPNWSLGMELQARAHVGAGVLLTLGQEQSWQHYGSVAGIAPELVTTEVKHRVSNSYIQAEWTPSEAFSATVGFQESVWTVDSANLNVAGTPVSFPAGSLQGGTPRLALIWQPTSVDIFKALYGGGYRNPTIFERYYTDISTFVANTELQPERITTLQGMWVRVWNSGLQSQLSLSRSRWRHLVQEVALPNSQQQYQNDPDDLVGTALEGELQGHWGGWGVYAQAGLYRWSEAGQAFPDSTGAQGAFRVTRHWGPWSASAELRYVGNRQGPPGVADAPAATVLRLASRWEGRRLWIRGTVEDAGQARRVDLVATDYSPITRMPSDGRTFFLTVGVPF
jgi:iron complex outermembrane receptor protein